MAGRQSPLPDLLCPCRCAQHPGDPGAGGRTHLHHVWGFQLPDLQVPEQIIGGNKNTAGGKGGALARQAVCSPGGGGALLQWPPLCCVVRARLGLAKCSLLSLWGRLGCIEGPPPQPLSIHTVGETRGRSGWCVHTCQAAWGELAGLLWPWLAFGLGCGGCLRPEQLLVQLQGTWGGGVGPWGRGWVRELRSRSGSWQEADAGEGAG